MVTGYCMRCGKKGSLMKDAKISKTAKGGFMAKGVCAKCGTKMCAMMSKETADAALKAGEAKKAEAKKA